MPVNKNANEALAGLVKGGQRLGLKIGGKNIKPGDHVSRAECQAQQSPPEISLSDSQGEYIVSCLDMDVPFPSFPILGPVQHWNQPGLKPNASGVLESGDVPCIADWMPPGPPPISGPHRYAFFLYEQPADFNTVAHAPPKGQKVSEGARMRYDLDVFEREAYLGPPVACTYLTCN